MTHLELHNLLGDRIKLAINRTLTPEEKQVVLEENYMVINLAKNMINNSNFILNAEKLLAQTNNLTESVLKELIGEK